MNKPVRRTLSTTAMRLAAVSAAAVLFASATRPAPAAAWPADPTALSHAVASAYESEEKGVIAVDVSMTTNIHGAMYHRNDEDATAFVVADGKLVHKVVLRHVEGGKADDGTALGKRSAEAESPLSRFGMRLPCDPAAMADYTFAAPVSTGSSVSLPFRAKVRDQAHGDGTILLDATGTHIESIAFQPTVNPDRASSSMVVLTFGSLGSGHYGIVKIVRTFTGHVGPLSGGVTSTSVYGNVRTFASAAAATDAVDHER